MYDVDVVRRRRVQMIKDIKKRKKELTSNPEEDVMEIPGRHVE